MIDSEIFRASRELGRSRLSPEEARNSFGYWIDVPNDWESYASPEHLVLYMGIHLTHLLKFNEVIEDLGPLTGREFDWVCRYVAFYDRVARLLCSTGHRVDLKCDLAETLADWRTILKFVKLPCRALDFGAGCGRQGVSLWLHDPASNYVAVDATLAGYTLQNLALSYMDTLSERARLRDFIDFECARKPFPDLRQARPGDSFHIPTWHAEAAVPENFLDVIIAAHVHNELSGPDFLRLVRIIEKSLALDGIVYVRSELALGDTRDYFDAVDLHGIELLKEMQARQFAPVWCKFVSGYLSTVFARTNSSHWRAARKSKDPDCQFLDVSSSQELSARAGQNYLRRCGQALAEANPRTVIVGADSPFYQQFVRDGARKVKQRREFPEQDILGDRRGGTLEEIRAFNPEAMVIASQQYPAIEAMLARELPQMQFQLRRYYWYPVVILHRRSVSGADCVFGRSILTPADLEEARQVRRS